MNVTDWYWRLGIRRLGVYAISASWLDQVMKIEEHQEIISSLKNNAKPCLALWGPSQGGKSTLLGQYLDGTSGDGSNSPLTWGGVNTRFSGTTSTPLETLVFNPYRAGLDASGLPTRFFAAETVDEDHFPVEIRLTSRKQIFLSLLFGYLSESQDASDAPVTQAWVDNELASYRFSEEEVDRDAFECMRDACDVIQILSTSEFNRFSHFRGNTERSFRMKLLTEKKLISNIDSAYRFIFKLFWNDIPKLNKLCRMLIEKRNQYELIWQGKKIRISMAGAVVLENISSADQEATAHTDGRMSVHQSIIQNLGYSISEQGVHIDYADIPGKVRFRKDDFAYFQALVGEMRIPVAVSKVNSSDFKQFLLRADLLDLPGVTNVPIGTAAVASTKLNLADPSVDDVQILTRLYKTGKTLSVIYGQVEKMEIDAFSLSIGGTALPLRRPNALQQGVKRWICSLAPEWRDNSDRQPLQFYINLTAFGDRFHEMENASDSANLLDGYLQQIKMLPIARPSFAKFFFTSHRYAHLLASLNDKEAVKNSFLKHPGFCSQFLSEGRESFDALCEDGYGTDYLFRTIAGEISTDRRFGLLQKIEEADRENLRELLKSNLPVLDENESIRDRTGLIDDISRKIDSGLIPSDDLIFLLKNIYAVDPMIFHELPDNMSMAEDGQVQQYILEVFGKWKENRSKYFKNGHEVELGHLINGSKLNLFLEAVTDIPLQDLARYLKGMYRGSSNWSIRKYLPLIFENFLFYREVERSTSLNMIDQFKKNLLSMKAEIHISGRPEQPGDSELQDIYSHLFGEEGK